MRQSLRIIEQVIAKLPGGPVVSDDYRVVLPPKEMVYNEMEGLIFHFKNVFEGIQVPAGEIYSYTEGANGELGYSIVSDGSGRPYRVKVRPPCFPLFAAFEKIIVGGMVVRRRRDARDAQHHRRRAGPVGEGDDMPGKVVIDRAPVADARREALPAAPGGDGADAPEVRRERPHRGRRARRSSTRRSGATTPTATAGGTS